MYSEQELLDSYLQHWYKRQECDAWAHSELGKITSEDPERAWDLTLKLIEQADTKGAIAYIAAGSLETLLSVHGELFFARAKELAKKDKKFLFALANVWLEEDDAVFVDLNSLLIDNGLNTKLDVDGLIPDDNQ